MSLIQKILTGGQSHKSRFHDEKGNLLDMGGFAYLPHCLATTTLRLMFGHRPLTPWLGYRAIQRLERLLQADWKILEWGSGFSTIYFAQRVSNVVSIEDNQEWYKKVTLLLAKHKCTNVDYQFKSDRYANLDEYPDHKFDFILIDGSCRAGCAATAINKVRPGGYIYLDNSDKHSDIEGGDTRIAENLLLDTVMETSGKVQYFVDLVPSYLAVTQGMLVRL
jgi:hypothetical protein